MLKAIQAIRKHLGNEIVSVDADDLRRHGYSEWSPINSTLLPSAVVYPSTTDQVSLVARLCHRYKIPMMPYAGGSSLEANFATLRPGICVDLSNMVQILAFHEDDMDVVVQAGILWTTLNGEIEHSGLFFPLDPGPMARIGGMIGTSCSGTNAVRYGTMKDWVINLTAVLSDGRVIKTRRRPRKSSAGYNLTNLFIGAEGTLGFVTEATLKLAVIPEETSVAILHFEDISEAARAATKVMRAGVPIAAMEVVDDAYMRTANGVSRDGSQWEELPTMFIKFAGTRAMVDDNIQSVELLTDPHRTGPFRFAKSAEEEAQFWSVRKDALPNILSLRSEELRAFLTDVAVPLSRLPDIMSSCRKHTDDLGLFACSVAHVRLNAKIVSP